MSSNEKQSVALRSMAASALMTVGKFAVGWMTGSLGLVSEGLHSLLDFGATVITFMAVRASDKPADDDHPYGHGKIESMAALAETLLLFLTSAWIIYEAVHRLIEGRFEVEVTPWSIGVIVVSMAIDISRARALRRVAKITKSQALEADALHFSSDVLSSGVVLVGLIFVALGWPRGDALAAVGVSLFVCHAGWVMGKRTFDTLIDTAPLGATSLVRTIVERVDGVASVDRVRLRPAGNRFFVEADIAVARSLSLTQVADIRQRVVAAVQAEMEEAEVSIATHPLALDNESVLQRVMVIAANHGAHVHHVTSYVAKERLFVGFDLEVDGDVTLQAAHEIATRLEADMRVEFGRDTEVETHIEPLQDRGINGTYVEGEELERLKALLEQCVHATGSLHESHNVRARRVEQGLVLLYHCRTAPDRTVEEVHRIVDDLERRLRREIPGIWRIFTHVEPDRAASVLVRPFVFRKARADDAAFLCDLIRQSVTALCRADHHDDPAVLARWLANKTPAAMDSWIAAPDGIVMVAERDGVILAVGAATNKGKITLNYVLPSARLQGISRAMVAALEKWILQQGATSCYLHSTETARRFYKEQGYTEQPVETGNFGIPVYPMTKTVA